MSDRTADALVEEGLRLYSRGKLDDALRQWRRALDCSPGLVRAQEYISYVEDNRRALEQTFTAVHSQQPPPGSAGSQAAPSSAAALSVAAQEPARSRVRRGGAAGDGRSAEEQSLGSTRDDEDLTPRVEISEELLTGGSQSPPLAQRRGVDPAARRPHLPMAQEELTRDLDAPEPTTGRMGTGTSPPVEVAVSMAPQRGFLPEAALGEGDAFQIEGGAETPASMIRKGPRGNQLGEGDFSVRDATHEFDRSDHVTSNVLGGEIDEAPVAVPPPLPALSPLPALDSLEPGLSGGGSSSVPTPRSTLPIGATESVPAPPKGAPSASHSGAEEGLEGMLEGARQLFEQGTFEGSLWLCERILAKHKDTGAKALLARNQEMLLGEYQQKIADLDQVPVVRIPQQEIVWHKLDHRAGFLLSRVDGVLSYGDILDISGMSNFEAYRILAQLLDQGVIATSR